MAPSAQTNMDLSLRQILERYKDDSEILKHVLTAKVEEDKVGLVLLTKSCEFFMF